MAVVLRSEERLLADDGRAMGSASCWELGSVVRECFDWGFGGVVDDWGRCGAASTQSPAIYLPLNSTCNEECSVSGDTMT